MFIADQGDCIKYRSNTPLRQVATLDDAAPGKGNKRGKKKKMRQLIDP